jgi:hypothetical protein
MSNKDQKVINAAFQDAIGQILQLCVKEIDFYSMMFMPNPSDGIIDKHYMARAFVDAVIQKINENIDYEVLHLIENVLSISYQIDLDACSSCMKKR